MLSISESANDTLPPNQTIVFSSKSQDNTNDSTQPLSHLSFTDPQPPCMSLLREIIFVASISSSQLLTQACLAQSITPLHIIGPSLGVFNPSYLSWMPAAYSLTVGTFILPSGRIGDVFGHRKIFIIGYVWLAFASLLTGFSIYSGFILFDICRGLQGIGPALLLPNGIAILGRTYPPGRRKDMVFSIFASTAPSGFVVGALFSALFAQLAWWPWAYFATAVAAMIMAGASMFAIPAAPSAQPVGETPSLFQRLDGFGTVTGVAGLILVSFAWNQGSIVGWPTVYVYVLLILGLGTMALFFAIETRVPCPLLPLHSLSRDTGFVLACAAAGWSAFGIWIYYLWQFMEVLRHETTPLQATAYFVPVAGSGLCAALAAGKLLGVVRPGFVMLVSMSAFTAGSVVMATCSVDSVYWAGIFVSCLVMPWGMVRTYYVLFCLFAFFLALIPALPCPLDTFSKLDVRQD